MSVETITSSAPMSLRAYAQHRRERGLPGGSHVAVKKAIETGRITPLPDGKIDPEQADAQWKQTTPPRTATASHARHGGRHNPLPRAGMEIGDSSLATARAIREQFLARLAKLQYEERVGKLISRDEVQVAQFNANRIIRDGLQNIADRVCGAITSEIASALAAAGLPAELAQTIDLAKVHAIISGEVRKALGDTSDDLTRRAGSI